MKVAVTDANIFIDLCELGGLEWLRQLGLEIYTTDIILSELSTEQATAVRRIVSVVDEMTIDIVAYMASQPLPSGLSDADKSVIWQAQQLSGTVFLVLTGDNLMRKWCISNQIEVHGILWIFDQLLLHSHLNHATACKLLIKLMQLNQWLPVKACEERLKEWEQIGY